MCTKMTKCANIVDNCKFTILGKSSKPTNTEPGLFSVQFYTKITVLNKCVQLQMCICAAKNNETITWSHKRIEDVTIHVFRAWSVPNCICSWPGLCWGNSQQWPHYAKDFSLWTKETLTALDRFNLSIILWPLEVVLRSRSNCLYAGH